MVTTYSIVGVTDTGTGTQTQSLVANGTTGQVLQANTAALSSYSTATFPSTATGTGTILRADGTNWVASTSTYPNTNAVSTLLYASSANVMGALATVNRAGLTTTSAGVPTWIALTDGQLVVGSSAGSPAAAAISAGTGIAVTNASNSITIAQSATVATNFGTSAAPTGTSSTAAYVMVGLGSSWKITPTTYTKVRATINGQMANNTTADGINIIIAFGTGTAPIAGASVTGTTVGINTIFTDLTGLTTNGVPFCKDVIITGLTPTTAYWIDLQFKAVTGGTASVINVEFSAQEIVN